MNVEAMKKILQNCTEENIIFDEPHVSERCREYKITKENILYIMFKETNTLINVIEDRPQVYKIYFRLNKRRQLKMIIDLLELKKVRIRTLRTLDRKVYKNLQLRRKGRW
ncbi:hypothetical protein HYS50_03060 [Candidatus Woesearchaeota archaeon]|nr:hypothetical protein [Candidatus Woesearchaeota archaeon]